MRRIVTVPTRRDPARAPLAAAALLGALLIAGPPPAGARSAAPTPAADSGHSGPRVVIVSVPPGADVHRGTDRLGVTPLSLTIDDLLGGERDAAAITISGGAPDDWLRPSVTDTLRATDLAARAPVADGPAADGSIELRYDLPLAVRIDSEPSGAAVYEGDSLLGATPLVVALRPGARSVEVRMAGRIAQTLLLDRGSPRLRAVLPREGGGGADTPPALAGPPKGYRGIVIAGGAAVLSGAASAWLKNQADRSLDDYRLTGDRATLDRVRRYDLFAGIALAVAELSLGYVVFELLSR